MPAPPSQALSVPEVKPKAAQAASAFIHAVDAGPQPPVAAPRPDPAVDLKGASDYVLGTGDEIRLTVYGEDDLSGQYVVGSTGMVALPLVGNVQAANHTIGQFETAVAARLAQGYLKDPKVSVQVATYRPFYILGEIVKPGSYAYVSGMNVLNAVALAGGYTYRADSGDIRVIRASNPAKDEQDIAQTGTVMPGDILRVTERYF